MIRLALAVFAALAALPAAADAPPRGVHIEIELRGADLRYAGPARVEARPNDPVRYLYSINRCQPPVIQDWCYLRMVRAGGRNFSVPRGDVRIGGIDAAYRVRDTVPVRRLRPGTTDVWTLDLHVVTEVGPRTLTACRVDRDDHTRTFCLSLDKGAIPPLPPELERLRLDGR